MFEEQKNISDKNQSTVTEKKITEDLKKLPCRGCLTTCDNYTRCQKKPIWR